MPKLIKNAQVSDNPWTVVARDASPTEGAFQLVPLELFLENPSLCLGKSDMGVWLDSDQGPEALEPYLAELCIIAINFPKFVDGRGYSYARLLRERFAFEGDVVAIGDVLHDQLFYMKRCGFNVFAIADGKDAEAALAGLTDFSESYQTAVDQPSPLYRRRA